MTIRDRKFRQLMKEAGMEDIQLERNNGYFYVWSDTRELNLYSNSIMRCWFSQTTPEQWVKDIAELITPEYQEMVSRW